MLVRQPNQAVELPLPLMILVAVIVAVMVLRIVGRKS